MNYNYLFDILAPTPGFAAAVNDGDMDTLETMARQPLPDPSPAMCEVDDCQNEATTEYINDDEFNDPFESNPSIAYTLRCDDHPETDPDYHAQPIN